VAVSPEQPAAAQSDPGEDGLCPEGMAVITPGGSFKMRGSITPRAGDDPETYPVVSVEAFCLDVTAVTVEAYAVCVTSGQCNDRVTSEFWANTDQGKGACNWRTTGRENHPINCVDWEQSSTFCQAKGKRLPTQEEWEWAGRGGDEGRRFPWGNDEPRAQSCWSGDRLRAAGDKGTRTHTCPVGNFPSGNGRWDTADLAGNVWEWTSSADGVPPVQRGGSWKSRFADELQVLFALHAPAVTRFADIGFRCAKDLPK